MGAQTSSRLAAFIRPITESAVAVAIGLIVGAFLMLAFGYDPIRAYVAMFAGAFGSTSGILESLAFATPLMATAVTFAVGVRASLFNIGAEGQMYIGAMAAAIVGGTILMPAGVHPVVATIAAMCCGALWALPAAVLKVWRGVHEVVSTIMLNWIAFWFVTFLIRTYFGEPGRAERAIPAVPTARYPVIGGTLTAVIFVVVIFCIAVTILLWRTGIGFELRLVGDNPEAAKYAGASGSRAILTSFLVGGLAAGLAGASQILGRPPSWTLYATLGNLVNLGFDGIGVALIGMNHPIGGIFAAIFYGGLAHGGRFMEYNVGVASELVDAINGIIVIALAMPEVIAIIRRRRES
jgi:simple sugar transport system permease protein